MKPERFHKTKSVLASCAIALVVAALVIAVSSLIFGSRSASPERLGFDLTSNPSSFTITSAIYANPSCNGTPALLYPGTTRCAVFSVHNLLSVPITVQSITSALDTSFPAPPANCAPPTYFTLPTFSGAVTVGAGTTTALPGVPIKLIESGNSQNACRNFNYHFTYSGSAQYTDSTTTVLTSTPNPSNLGQSVTFKATVTAGNPSTDSSPPSGTVSFYKCTSATVCPNTSTNLLGTGSISGGVANFSTTTLPQGVTWVDAVYPASGTNFTGSTSSVVTQDVGAATTTAITSSPNPSALGTSVTFTATVTKSAGTGSPTGTVSFYSGTPTGTHTLLATDPLNTGTGKATYSTSSTSILPLGTDHIYAVYNGDTNFSGSTSPVLNQVVTTAACTGGTINGGYTIKSGQFVCFTGTVNGGVTIQSGGGLYLSGARINGGITSTTATTLIVCGSTVNGNISATGATGIVLIGDGGDDGPPGCAANTITGNITLTNGKGGFEIAGNTITGTVTLSGNTGSGPNSEDVAPEVEGNEITGTLSCATSNSPTITDGVQKNTVTGTKSGECAGSTF